jgi:ABC-2 type transport system ATP-binding protein
MIRAQGLGRTFGRFVAVESLDLDVAEGEVFGLLGPNGAGKTTTVRLLTGVIEPTSGTATVAGHSVRDAPEKVRAQVGILTETPGLYVRLDAVENL